MNPKLKLMKARATLVLAQPFFGTLALKLALQEDPTVQTMSVNGKAIRYNPEWVSGLTSDEVKGVLAHEVMHCACNHHTRRQGRDPQTWNRAGDYAINGILMDAGFTLPEDGLYDPAFKGMSAEHIYNLIYQPPQDDGSGGGDGDDDGQQDPGGCGAVEDAPPDVKDDGKDQASGSSMAEQERDWNVAVAQATQAARSQGKMPGDLDRMVQALLRPKANWRDLLRRFVENTARSDYSWFPPNRRYIHQGLYLPSVKSERLKPVVVAVDTSGSVTEDLLKQFASEVRSILEDCNPELVHVVYCDWHIQGSEVFTPEDFPESLAAKGGGGTSFAPVFEWIAEQEIEPTCLIYLTDLYGWFPEEEPDYPVLWADYDGTRDQDGIPFGERVQIQL